MTRHSARSAAATPIELELRACADEATAMVPDDLAQRILGQILPLPATALSATPSWRMLVVQWSRMMRPMVLAAVLSLALAVTVLASTVLPGWLSAVPVVPRDPGAPAAVPASVGPLETDAPSHRSTPSMMPAAAPSARPTAAPTKRPTPTARTTMKAPPARTPSTDGGAPDASEPGDPSTPDPVAGASGPDGSVTMTEAPSAEAADAP